MNSGSVEGEVLPAPEDRQVVMNSGSNSAVNIKQVKKWS